MPPPTLIDRCLSVARIDFEPTQGQPPISWVLVATVIAIGGSLLADAWLVAIGTHVFPSTRGYVHFRFSDYAKLTVIGVVVACAAWPIVTRVTSSPRWLFFRLALLVTAVLLLPDLWLVSKGQPSKAVAVLMTMHLAIALVTYNALVRVAAPRSLASPSDPRGTNRR